MNGECGVVNAVSWQGFRARMIKGVEKLHVV